MALPPPPSSSTRENNHRRKKIFGQLIRIILGLALAFAILSIDLDSPEYWFHDLRLKFDFTTKKSDLIELIVIDGKTISTLNRVPDALDHLKVAENIQKQNPLHMLYEMDISNVPGPKTEQIQLAKFISQKNNIIQITQDLAMKGEEGKLHLPPPFENVVVMSGPKTTDRNTFGKDGVTRRMLISYQDQPMIQPVIASQFKPELSGLTKIRGQFTVYDSQQIFIRYLPKNSFITYKFEDILLGKITLPSIAGKLILVGTDTGTSFKDYVATPFDHNPGAMPLVEMQANMFETLLQNKAPIQAPKWLNWIFVAVISILTIEVVLGARPLIGLVILSSTFAGFVLLAFTLFWSTGYLISMIHPILSIFLTYYFFIPYRLIKENRRSWEYYQKNQLLKQVEELKTNFISMMSHDLKTPIARIQGMTDLISRDDNPLSSPQREAVDTIKQSSEDLLKFINSILSYGKIESEGVQLQKQSKDINALIEEVVRKHEFLARVKKIHILTELEPLFPIQVDSELMKQIFSNLLENAIKYSPEETKVLITSEERNNRIIVQISDQGVGIPEDELPHIFMKFFRSKNAKSSPIKGSGLGLYLAKYFTELHGGMINVDSSTGNGTTFTVELPIVN